MRPRSVVLAFAVAACTCTTPQASPATVDHVPSAAAPAPGGVLVGLTPGTTYWIPITDSSAGPVVSRSPYLVPRQGTWWWVGTVSNCTLRVVQGHGGSPTTPDAWIDRTTRLWRERAGDSTVVTIAGDPCVTVAQAAYKRDDARAHRVADSLRAGGDSAGARDVLDAVGQLPSYECQVTDVNVTHVSARYVSGLFRSSTTEFCDPTGFAMDGENVVLPFEEDSTVALRPLLAPTDWASVVDVLGAGDGYYGQAAIARDAAGAWALRHERGAWQLALWINGPTVARGGLDFDGEVISVPPSISGDSTALPFDWFELQRQFPGAVDAAASPDARLLLVLRDERLYLLRIHAGAIADTLLDTPVVSADAFVMIRWATLAEAAQWTRTIPALPEPKLRIVSP